MIKLCLKCLRGITITVLAALYLFAGYELLVIPAVLDWSVYGVMLVLGLSGLLIWSMPGEQRLSSTVLGFAFLLMIQALHNIGDFPLWQEIAAGLFIFILLFIVSRVLGKVSRRKFLAFFIMAVVLNSVVDLAQVPFWSEFTVKWESPVLYERYASADYFPLTLADIDGDNTAEIITQQNLAGAIAEQAKTAKEGKMQRILEPETNYYAVYKWDGDSFAEIPYSSETLKPLISIDYIGFPFYAVSVLPDQTHGLRQELVPLIDRAELAEQAVRFGSFPFNLLRLDGESLAAMSENLPAEINPIQTPAKAAGSFTGNSQPQIALIDEGLAVRQMGASGQPLGLITSAQVPDIGIGELLTGDVDYDGTQEILLTVENSKILKLGADGTWQTLWANPEPFNPKTRFQKFRFEAFAKLGDKINPEIIALAKSNVRENPTRYMTGYTYQDGSLKQSWRVFTGLINLRAGDIDGDGENELIGYMYRGHRIFVLEKHNLPVTQTLYLITALLIISGLWRQRQAKVSRGGRLGMLLVLSLLVFAGCSVPSGPTEFSRNQPPARVPAPDAAGRLAQAFSDTTAKGSKFMYSGHAVTRVQKRNIGFYASGSYDKEKGYNMDGRIFGQPFRFYRWGSDTYVSVEDKWKKAAQSELPLEPFADLSMLNLPYAKAVKLPDSEILGKNCDVYQITLNAKEAVEAAKSMGIMIEQDSPKLAKQIPEAAEMTITYWVGKQTDGSDPSFIYQYKVETLMPVPAAGTMFQEIVFRFWNYNDQGIKIQSPDKITPYLVKE